MIAGRPKKMTETGRPSYDTTSLNARTGGGGVVVLSNRGQMSNRKGACQIARACVRLLYLCQIPPLPVSNGDVQSC